jgi:hypothetical protein
MFAAAILQALRGGFVIKIHDSSSLLRVVAF